MVNCKNIKNKNDAQVDGLKNCISWMFYSTELFLHPSLGWELTSLWVLEIHFQAHKTSSNGAALSRNFNLRGIIFYPWNMRLAVLMYALNYCFFHVSSVICHFSIYWGLFLPGLWDWVVSGKVLRTTKWVMALKNLRPRLIDKFPRSLIRLIWSISIPQSNEKTCCIVHSTKTKQRSDNTCKVRNIRSVDVVLKALLKKSIPDGWRLRFFTSLP